MTELLHHPIVKKVVNKKTILWFTIFKLVTYIVLGGIFFANKHEANAAKLNNQVKIATEQRVYFIDYKSQRKKAYNNEKAFLSYGQRFNNISTITPDEINQWPDAKLIKQKNSKVIYYIANGQKCAISGPSQLKKSKLDKEPVLTVNITDLNSYKNAKCSELLLPIGGSDNFKDFYTDKYVNETISDYSYAGVKVSGKTNGSYAPGTKNNILGTFTISNNGSETILLRSISFVTTDQDIKSTHGFYNLAVSIANTNKKLGYTIAPHERDQVVTLGRYELPSRQSITLNITVDTLSYVPIGNVSNTLTKLDFQSKDTRTNASVSSFDNPTLSVSGQLSSASGGTSESTNQPETVKTAAPIARSPLFTWPTTTHVVNYYFEDPTYPFRNEFAHNGLDIDAHQGSSVFAVQDGTIIQVIDNHDTNFNYIRIRHEDGTETGYGHLSQINIKLGQLVARGAKIGLSGGQPGTIGAGSYTTGAHLHFEVIKNNVFIDPMTFLK